MNEEKPPMTGLRHRRVRHVPPDEAVLASLANRYGGAGTEAGRPAGPDCLSPERVAAYATGSLQDDERRSLEAHVAACDRCAAEVASVMEVAGPPPIEEARRVFPLYELRWARMAAVILVAVALGSVGGLIYAWRRATDSIFRERLADAMVKAQRVAGLYHLSPYKRRTTTPDLARVPVDPTRGPETLPPEVKAVAEQHAQEAADALAQVRAVRRHRGDLHLAEAELAAECGQYDQALRLIERALRETTKPAERTRALTVKATVLLDRGWGTDEIDGLKILDHLIAEIKAGRIPEDADVYYNRAMADQTRGAAGPETRELWAHYLRVEKDPEWRRVANQYLKEIPKP